jgi:hypothetical protein
VQRHLGGDADRGAERGHHEQQHHEQPRA